MQHIAGLRANHCPNLCSQTIISGITGRGWQSAPPPPETSDWEISADLSGKHRQGKMEKGGKWRRKIVKGKMEIK